MGRKRKRRKRRKRRRMKGRGRRRSENIIWGRRAGSEGRRQRIALVGHLGGWERGWRSRRKRRRRRRRRRRRKRRRNILFKKYSHQYHM